MAGSDAKVLGEIADRFDEVLTPEAEAAHRMTPAEIEEVVEGYGAAAELAVSAGLDGVELRHPTLEDLFLILARGGWS